MIQTHTVTFLDGGKNEIDYITLFRIGDVMRANVFTQLKASDPRVNELKNSTYESLLRHFPDLESFTGSFEITSKVEVFSTYFYRMITPDLNGIVVIGDAYQSVSPTTGTGLSKVLNDVDVLCNIFVPRWIENKTFESEHINGFYNFSQKTDCDSHSKSDWEWYGNPANRRGFIYKLKKNPVVQWLVRKLELKKVAKSVRKLRK